MLNNGLISKIIPTLGQCKLSFIIQFLFMLQLLWAGNRQTVAITGLLEDRAIFSLSLALNTLV